MTTLQSTDRRHVLLVQGNLEHWVSWDTGIMHCGSAIGTNGERHPGLPRLLQRRVARVWMFRHLEWPTVDESMSCFYGFLEAGVAGGLLLVVILLLLLFHRSAYVLCLASIAFCSHLHCRAGTCLRKAGASERAQRQARTRTACLEQQCIAQAAKPLQRSLPSINTMRLTRVMVVSEFASRMHLGHSVDVLRVAGQSKVVMKRRK